MKKMLNSSGLADGFNADREEVRLQDVVIIVAECMFLRLVESQNSKQRN